MRILAVLALLMLASTAMGQMTTSDMPKIDCAKCHTCPDPTPEKMCLKPCPTLTMAHSKGTNHQLSEAPDTLLLDDIADLYGPVHFNHKVHARMAEMNSNCQTCHHYSPAGKISPCKECHGGETNPNNLRQPGLKGAYHRQCLSCHREWSHDTQCTICHTPQAGKQMSGTIADSTDVMGKSHPLITPPVTKVYRTPYAKGPVVTFFHKEHIDLFGLKCVDCHKQENCSYCHDLKPAERKPRTQVEIHAVCSDCHKTDECSKCHGTKEKPAFSHAITGWPLNRFHKGLDCRACHPTGKKIARLNNQCASCHAGWNQANFSHAVTGLILDENHREMDCTDCHTDRKYNEPPSCSGCHDDNRSYKDAPPGSPAK
jgi:hypothetical protein